MKIKTFTARDLNQRSGAITHAVDEGFDVVITKRGRPAYRVVAVSHEPAGRSLLNLMAELPDVAKIEMDIDRVDGRMREVDL
jgi:prevent-host-death family protein